MVCAGTPIMELLDLKNSKIACARTVYHAAYKAEQALDKLESENMGLRDVHGH